MKMTTISISLPRVSRIERLARKLGTTTTRCPYCGQHDLRPSTHLERVHPLPLK